MNTYLYMTVYHSFYLIIYYAPIRAIPRKISIYSDKNRNIFCSAHLWMGHDGLFLETILNTKSATDKCLPVYYFLDRFSFILHLKKTVPL